MRYRAAVAAAILVAVLAGGCGGEANRVPDVEGKRLDVAQELLDDAGLGYEVIGGGVFGVVVRSNWEVCEQRPPAGRRAKSVDLVVARSCAYPLEDDFEFDDDDDDFDFDFDDDEFDDDDDF
jgi:beta-lactam-binding protein with PASTA domain